MKPLVTINGVACPLALANVDTDQLIPARFMKQPRAAGYGSFLLHDLRRDADGREITSFPLNRPEWRDASVLVARRNFGSGSSREAAVYALADAGIRVVLAPTFGDIFASNSVKNGLLPAVLNESDIDDLIVALQATPGLTVDVDLQSQTVQWNNRSAHFSIDPVWREQLINGWDDIDVTRSFADTISSFILADAERRPWMRPHKAR